jgi:cation-transporting P-type ATPase C
MSSALRISLQADGVSIWSSDIFAHTAPSRVREFLARAFAVAEVENVELRRASAFGRIRHSARSNPAQIWKKLSRALGAADDIPAAPVATPAALRVDADYLFLDTPRALPIRVNRVGDVLSTWQIRSQTDGTLRLAHPLLRRRRDVAFRLEEELAALFGVADFRVNPIGSAVAIRFDPKLTTASRLALELEKAWPRLLRGLDGPPSRTRLFVSAGLVGLAYTGQYLMPALRPAAVAGVTLYSLPNVVKAVRDLTRAQVGIYALYSAGLGFMLVSGMPFTASVMQALMQLWPHVARRKAVLSQRQLFGFQRRLPAWARSQRADGSHVATHVDALRPGDVVVVESGEVTAVDGVVEGGSAAVREEVAFGGRRVDDKSAGDAVSAGALVLDGKLIIRVERAGADSSAAHLASLLPHGTIARLPASDEAERVANRNAKPALLLSALTLALTRTAHPAQALLRPDYASGPRLSAQLSALYAIARAFQAGVLFRNPAALDRLDAADVYVIDDSAGIERHSVEVAGVQSVSGVAPDAIAGHALAAQRGSRSETSAALEAFARKRNVEPVQVAAFQRSAGVARYRDTDGHTIEIASSHHVSSAQLEVPHFPARLLRKRAQGAAESALASDEPSLRPLWVLRDGHIVGVVTFTRTGPIVGRALVQALAARSNDSSRPARVVYLSRAGQAEAQRVAEALGIEYRAGLGAAAKAELIRGLGRSVLWLGDGSDPAAKDSITASTVSLSVAPLSRARDDAADILSPHRGLSSLATVLDIGRTHAARLAQDYRVVYSTNLLGVVSAFLVPLSTLHVGLLSHLGNALIYSRQAMALGGLTRALEQRRQQLLAGAS